MDITHDIIPRRVSQRRVSYRKVSHRKVSQKSVFHKRLCHEGPTMGNYLGRNLPTANVSSGNFPLSHLSISYSGKDPGRSSRRSAALSDYLSFGGRTWRPDSRVPGRAHSRTRLVLHVHTTLFICCQAQSWIGSTRAMRTEVGSIV